MTFGKLERGFAAWRPRVTGRGRGRRNEDHRHLTLQGKVPLSTDGSNLGGRKPRLHREASEAHWCSLQVCRRGLSCLISYITVYRLLSPIPSHLCKNTESSRKFPPSLLHYHLPQSFRVPLTPQIFSLFHLSL